jgi:predicted nicotinamide N-methyase
MNASTGDFTYFVWGTRETGIVKARVKQDKVKLIKAWKVIELAENSDAGLKVPCW